MPKPGRERSEAAPRARVRVSRLREGDLDAVLAIERVSFPTAWTRDNFLYELRENRFARNLALRVDSGLGGYACLWALEDELKINNIALRPDLRGTGLGHVLLRACLEVGLAEGCKEATLEVRPSNVVARRLYERYGFREIGRRSGYYQDTREDAVLMAARLDRALWPSLPAR
jgi:ribosomal-protein-alanine N-acetyltransferase